MVTDQNREITIRNKNRTQYYYKIKGDFLIMREIKTQKSKITINLITNLPESNSNLNISSQTPIEIALKIDENGMTTASNLYAFLELEPKKFCQMV